MENLDEEQKLIDAVRLSWLPPSKDHADLWIENNVILGSDSDMQGPVRFDMIPMVRFLLRKCQDPKVRRVVVMVSAQSAKTKTMEMYLVWKIKNEPTPTIWFLDDDKQAKNWSQTRLDADLRNCAAISAEIPRDRNRKKWYLTQFSSMDLYVRGVNAKGNVEQVSAQTVICDERRRYPPGKMQQVRNRYKAFRKFKEISISTAGMENDDLDQAYKDGTRHEFHWRCLSCGHRQPFRFGRDETAFWKTARECGGMVWDADACRVGDHTYDMQALMKTVRYECENPACKRRYHPWEKGQLIQTMDESSDWGAVQTNPMASGETVSMHWNEMYMPWAECEWPKIVEKFLQAQNALHVRRDIMPLQVFIQESLGEPWRQLRGDSIDDADILKRCGDYKLGEEYGPDVRKMRLLTIDVQHGHLKYLYRQYAVDIGESRLIDCGKFLSFDDVRTFQLANKIKDGGVGIDCAHNTAGVLRECAKYGRWVPTKEGKFIWDGWTPLLGDDSKGWVRSDEKQKVRVFWQSVDINANEGLPGAIKLVQRVSWSNDHYKDRLYLYLLPGVIAGWTLPSNVAVARKEYIPEVTCLERVEIRDAAGVVTGHEWTDHGKRHDYSDCELMQQVMLDLAG